MIGVPIMQFNLAAKQLKAFSQTATIRHSGITFLGTVINGLLGVFYFFYLASKLSPDNFGRFSIAVGITAVGFSLFSFGLDQALVKYKNESPVMSNILFIRFITAIIISILPLIIYGYDNLFGLVGMGIAVKLLFSLAVNILQSWQQYSQWSLLFISTNLLRFLVSIILKTTNPYFHLIGYIVMPFTGFLIFYLFRHRRLPKPSFKLKITKDLLKFNLPLTASSIISAITAQIDTFFIAGFQSFAVAGIYSLSSQLASSVSQLSTAYSAVISPKFSSLDQEAKNQVYLKKNLWLSSFISLLLVPTLFIAGYVLFTISGEHFSQSYLILLLLLIGYAIFFATVPLRESLLYYYGDSKVFLNLTVLNLLFSIFSGLLLIRPYGPVAAASSFLVIQIVSVIILIFRYVQNRRSHYR